jgi:hypothetical protein
VSSEIKMGKEANTEEEEKMNGSILKVRQEEQLAQGLS